jgi:hypothetical protein
MKTNFVKKKCTKKKAPVRRRHFRHFRILFPSNPPGGIFGFYPGKGSAYSSLHENWYICHNRSYDGTHEVSSAIGRVKRQNKLTSSESPH